MGPLELTPLLLLLGIVPPLPLPAPASTAAPPRIPAIPLFRAAITLRRSRPNPALTAESWLPTPAVLAHWPTGPRPTFPIPECHAQQGHSEKATESRHHHGRQTAQHMHAQQVYLARDGVHRGPLPRRSPS